MSNAAAPLLMPLWMLGPPPVVEVVGDVWGAT